MLASEVAACKKAATKVERAQLFLATRWLVGFLASKLAQCNHCF